MGPLVRLIGQGIGLAREGIAARKAASNTVDQVSEDGNARDFLSPPPYEGQPAHAVDPGGKYYGEHYQDPYQHQSYGDYGPQANITNFDEQEWYLDDVAEEVAGPETPGYGKESVVEVNELVMGYAKSNEAIVPGRLECPVILPQRRPRAKSRGFVRAYAPMLGNCGIDQDTFLKFIKDFYESSKANPIFNVINIAAFGAGFAPSVTIMIVSGLVQFASETSKQIQARHRTNAFLDKMNERFFRPRGLYCMLITYQPLKRTKGSSVDTSMTIAKTITPADSDFKEKLKSIRTTSGVTEGEIEFPEAAPLVFPALDKAAEDAEKKSALKRGSGFLNEYLDRRAQAAYAHQNPGSKLSMPPDQQFASRYSDPNHPASNGSLISLLTGGHVNPRAGVDKLRQKYRNHKREKTNAEAAEEAGDGESKEVVPETKVANRTGVLRRILREDVIYLTIVNMPSEHELAEALEALELQKTNSQGSTQGSTSTHAAVHGGPAAIDLSATIITAAV